VYKGELGVSRRSLAQPHDLRGRGPQHLFTPRPVWVLSGSLLGWGDDVVASCDAVVLTWARGYDDPAFDGRSRAAHEAWLATLSVPVLRLDSARPRAELRDAVLRWE